MERPERPPRDWKWALFLLAGLAIAAGVYVNRLGDEPLVPLRPRRIPPVSPFNGWTPANPERLPNISHRDAQIATSAADTIPPIGISYPEFNAPFSSPARFDRRTVSPSIVFYWRSEDGDQAAVEQTVAYLEDASATMKEYLHPDDFVSKPLVYYVKSDDPRRGAAPRDAARGAAGRRAIDIACPQQELRGVAVHELAHFYTPRLRRCYERPALCEGLAVFMKTALDGGLGRLHEEARATVISHDEPGLFEMLGEKFYRLSDLGGRYTLGGSFVGFLVERHGIDPVLAVFTGSPFQIVFHKTRPELEAEWRAFLTQAKPQ